MPNDNGAVPIELDDGRLCERPPLGPGPCHWGVSWVEQEKTWVVMVGCWEQAVDDEAGKKSTRIRDFLPDQCRQIVQS